MDTKLEVRIVIRNLFSLRRRVKIEKQIALTNNFHSLKFSTKPSIVAELTLGHSTSGKVLWKTANCRDKGRLALLRNVRLGDCREIRESVPNCTREQPPSPINGLHFMEELNTSNLSRTCLASYHQSLATNS